MRVSAVALLGAVRVLALGQLPILSTGAGGNGTNYLLADANTTPQILVDAKDSPTVVLWAWKLAEDFKNVTGKAGTVVLTNAPNGLVSLDKFSWMDYADVISVGVGNEAFTSALEHTVAGAKYNLGKISTYKLDSSRPTIIAGTVGKSQLVDAAVQAAGADLDVSSFAKGKPNHWEAFATAVVKNPLKAFVGNGTSVSIDAAFVIAGSDKRGVAFGLSRVSEEIGVSPLWWWTDNPAPPIGTRKIYAGPPRLQKSPTTKYRGLFLNEEIPALTTFTAKKFPDTKPLLTNQSYTNALNADFYDPVFDMLIRLRANYYWPGSWVNACPWRDPRCYPLATLYGVFTGSSHTEPLGRYQGESFDPDKLKGGELDWTNNKANILAYWRGGLERAKRYDVFLTLGMRGWNDFANPSVGASNLGEIVAAQHALIKEVFGDRASEVDSAIPLFNEVLGLVEKGASLKGTAITYTDENQGVFKHLPATEEEISEATAGPGCATYFHFDSHGGIADWRMQAAANVAHTWIQMGQAMARGCHLMAVVNVGKFKSDEMIVSHYFDTVYEHTAATIDYSHPASITQWANAFATREFGPEHAAEIGEMLLEYSQLSARRKIDWLDAGVFSPDVYDEAYQNIARWEKLFSSATAMAKQLPEGRRMAAYHHLTYPIEVGYNLNKLFCTQDRQRKIAYFFGTAANKWSGEVAKMCEHDNDLRVAFNTVEGGKWDGAMDFVRVYHADYHQYLAEWPVCDLGPIVLNHRALGANASLYSFLTEKDATQAWDMQGPDPYSPKPVNPYESNRYWWLYLRGEETQKVELKTNVPAATLSPASITLTKDDPIQKFELQVDWAKIGSTANVTVTVGDGWLQPFNVILQKPQLPAGFNGFVESQGVVSMEACHTTSRAGAADLKGSSIEDVPHGGRTLCGLTALPLVYPHYIADPTSAPVASYDIFLGPTAVHTPNIELIFDNTLQIDCAAFPQVAVALDDQPPKAVDLVSRPVAACKQVAADLPSSWAYDTMHASHRVHVNFTMADGEVAGKHTLKVYFTVPGIVLTKIIVYATPQSWQETGPKGLEDIKHIYGPTGTMKTMSYLGAPESGRVGAPKADDGGGGAAAKSHD